MGNSDRRTVRLWGWTGVIAAGCITAGGFAYAVFAADSFGRAIGQALLEIALVVVLGAGLSELIKSNDRARLRLEEEHARRAEIFRRLRRIHERIAYVRTLIRVHDSGRSYTQQHRELMRLRPELEEIAEDLSAAPALFRAQQAEVEEAVATLVRYLKRGQEEYEMCHPCVDAAATANSAARLQDMATKDCDLAWTLNFANASDDFVREYEHPFTGAKRIMRGQVLGPSKLTANEER